MYFSIHFSILSRLVGLMHEATHVFTLLSIVLAIKQQKTPTFDGFIKFVGVTVLSYFLNFSFNAFSTCSGTKSDTFALYAATSFTTLELINE